MRKNITNPKIHQSTNPVLALVTAPDLKIARKLAKIILENRLAACANSTEVLMILKTTSARLKKLEQCVLENHPYDTPEFLVLPIATGNNKYLDWIFESVQG